MKTYKAIFFDWDGTAVTSRTGDTTGIVRAMKAVLEKEIRLIIISGTTYGNLCSGRLGQLFSSKELQYLYLGLGRGNYNYGFHPDGTLNLLLDRTPALQDLLRLHNTAYQIHAHLLSEYNLATDIIFSRPNYCKIDLTVENKRDSSALYLQEDEVETISNLLEAHKIKGGLPGLLKYAEETGNRLGLNLKATTDAKYLEIGYTTKSDNVDWFMDYFKSMQIEASDCCFWGDEFGSISPGIWGSDSQMITKKTSGGDFFSVSCLPLPLPNSVTALDGGVNRFIEFLLETGGMTP